MSWRSPQCMCHVTCVICPNLWTFITYHYHHDKSKATIIYPLSHPNRRHRQEGFTWHVVRAIGAGMQLAIEGLQELPSLLREPRPRPAAAFVGMWIVGGYLST